MKKKLFVALLSLLCVAACAFVFVACGGNPDGDSDSGTEPPTPQTVPVTGITVDHTTLTIGVGDEVQLSATVSPANATHKRIIWFSTNWDVVTVSESGLLVAKAPGTSTVAALPVEIFELDDDGDAVVIDGELIEKVYFKLLDNAAYCDITVENEREDNGIVYMVGGNNNDIFIVKSADKTIDTDVVIPSEFNGKPVAMISHNAFKDCSFIPSITIPDSVAYIKEGAFSGCTSLTSITLPFVGGRANADYYDGYLGYVFGGRSAVPSSLKTVVITGGTKIQMNAFNNCSNITSITLPDSVTAIGEKDAANGSAFGGCTSLESITIGANNTVFSGQGGILYNKQKTEIVHVPLAIKGAVTLPNSLVFIGWNAFKGCTAITSIAIPDSVTSIAGYAFSGCASLASVTIPQGVIKIESGAFRNCTSLKSITIPDSVTTVAYDAFEGCAIESATIPAIACGYIRNSALETVVINGGDSISAWAFEGCSSLTSLTIPDSVTSIGEHAFAGCANLAEIKGAKNVATIGQDALTGTAFLDDMLNQSDGVAYWGSVLFAAKPDISECTVKEGTVTIMPKAFKESALTDITIPASVVTIGNEAFADCSALSSVVFAPNSQLSSIGESAFIGCSALEEVDIPASVTTIGNWAFADCQALRSVSFEPNSQLWYIGEFVFNCEHNALEEIILPTSVTAIHINAFSGCPLKTVAAPLNGINYIPQSVQKLTITNGETIEAGALSSFYNLTELIIGADVQKLEPGALRGLGALQKLTLQDMGNTLGQLFGTENFNGAVKINQIVSYSGQHGEYAILSGDLYVPNSLTHVTVLGNLYRVGAFSNCANLTDIAWYGKASLIPHYTFYGCTALRTLILPSEQRYYIDHFAIIGCESLEKIFYTGTTGIWSFPQDPYLDKPDVSVYGTNDDISDKVYFYSKDPPTSDGRYWHYDEDEVTPIVWSEQE